MREVAVSDAEVAEVDVNADAGGVAAEA